MALRLIETMVQENDSKTVSELLKARGIIPSMSDKGNCSDNAMVETVFKTIKNELVCRTIFQTRAAAELALGRSINGFYNPRRRYSAPGYIVAWKLCTTMKAGDVTDTLELALRASSCDCARVMQRPRLLSWRNG